MVVVADVDAMVGGLRTGGFAPGWVAGGALFGVEVGADLEIVTEFVGAAGAIGADGCGRFQESSAQWSVDLAFAVVVFFWSCAATVTGCVAGKSV